MSALKAHYKQAITFTNTSQVSKFRVAAPTNQKQYVRFGLHWKGAGSSTFHAIEIRRGTSGGSLNSAVTWTKASGMDTETVQGSGYDYSAQPTNNGSIVAATVLKDDQRALLPVILMNGGETLDIWITPGHASAEADLTVEIEQ